MMRSRTESAFFIYIVRIVIVRRVIVMFVLRTSRVMFVLRSVLVMFVFVRLLFVVLMFVVLMMRDFVGVMREAVVGIVRSGGEELDEQRQKPQQQAGTCAAPLRFHRYKIVFTKPFPSLIVTFGEKFHNLFLYTSRKMFMGAA